MRRMSVSLAMMVSAKRAQWGPRTTSVRIKAFMPYSFSPLPGFANIPKRFSSRLYSPIVIIPIPCL